MKRLFLILLYINFICLFFTDKLLAGYSGSLMDVSPVTSVSEYKFYMGPDILIAKSGGVNGVVMIETGMSEMMSGRFMASTGSWHELILGGRVKFQMFPVESYQAGFSILTGGRYLRDNGINAVLFSIVPLISTDFSLEFAGFEPYFGVEFALLLSQQTRSVPINFLAGCAFTPKRLGDFSVFVEGNLSVIDSRNFFGIGLAFNFKAKH